VPTNKANVKGHADAVVATESKSLVRFTELLKLWSLAAATQSEYLRYVRKLAVRVKCDPCELDEAQVRAYLLHLKDAQKYSPSSPGLVQPASCVGFATQNALS